MYCFHVYSAAASVCSYSQNGHLMAFGGKYLIAIFRACQHGWAVFSWEVKPHFFFSWAAPSTVGSSPPLPECPLLSWWCRVEPVPWDLVICDLAFRFKQSNKLLHIKFAQKLIVKSKVHGWMVHRREPWLQRPLSWSRTSCYVHARQEKSGQNMHWLFGSVFQSLDQRALCDCVLPT